MVRGRHHSHIRVRLHAFRLFSLPILLICFAQRQPAVSVLPAYDILFRRHPDVTHLRLLSYRFMQRLQASDNRNEELESVWRRPEVPHPQYHRVKYLVSIVVACSEFEAAPVRSSRFHLLLTQSATVER